MLSLPQVDTSQGKGSDVKVEYGKFSKDVKNLNTGVGNGICREAGCDKYILCMHRNVTVNPAILYS